MHPDDELASLRRLLDALESGSMMLLLNGKDVTQEEVAKLKPDIEYLEAVLARIRSSGKSHPPDAASPIRAGKTGSMRRCER
jgi:hypothetical protein